MVKEYIIYCDESSSAGRHFSNAYGGALAQWWMHCIDGALRYPWTLKTDGFETVSVWIPPSGTEFSHDGEERIAGVLQELVGFRASEVGELSRRFDKAHPHGEPHYYLSLLGTRNEHRGPCRHGHVAGEPMRRWAGANTFRATAVPDSLAPT